MALRAALFDLDETLLDRSTSLRKFVQWQGREVLGFNAETCRIFSERFVTLDDNGMLWKDELYRVLIEQFQLSSWSVNELLDQYLNRFRDFCLPRKGALQLIQAFVQKEYKLGLVSNGKSPFQENNFHALGFGSYFDCIIVSEAVGLRKPDKAIFQLACDELGAELDSSLFIGDNPVADIQGAKQAGMYTAFVPIDAYYKPCAHADISFYDLRELAHYVSEHY